MSKCRILVVDDNESAADTLATLLNLMGNETCQAHDGVAAIEAAVRFRPDVVLLDISLPKLNGYEAAREIRRRLIGSEPRLVALSGWDEIQADGESVFDAYLTKPVEIATLCALLSARSG